MVGFLKRRTRVKCQTAVDLATNVLRMSLEISGGADIEDEHGAINRKALGYIFGFTDAVLQNRKLEITGRDGQYVLACVINALYPGKAGGYISFLKHHIQDAEIVGGAVYGGQQFVEWARNKDNAPLGFAKALLGD